MTARSALLKQNATFRFTDAEIRVFRKRERLTVSQWAERHRIVTNGPIQGPWSNEMTPYLIDPMDTWNLPWVRKIILCFAPQTGKTQIAFNCLCYAVDQDPGPAMYIMPDEKTAKRISRRRIIPMFKGSPRIRDIMSPKVDDTTIVAVQFKNGMDLMMAWATSASELASESVRYLFFDECDKFQDFSGKEADPISLGEIRTNAYPHTKKILYLSTPTTEDGPITTIMDREADEIRDYHVTCPYCGEMQKMYFDGIKWPDDVRDPRIITRNKLAKYMCCRCEKLWDDRIRNQAVRMGRWIARKPIDRPSAVGFQLPSWYSPFISLSDVAAAFLKGQDDPAKLMAFVTQHKAEAWKETIIPKQESGVLAHKTDIPPGLVPPEAVALTAGIDVQKNGFWFVIRAWTEELTSWLVQYGFLSTWADVEALVFHSRYQIKDSKEAMGIWRAAIDTGGGLTDDGTWTRTEEVYQWLRKVPPDRIFGTKGASHRQGFKKIKETRIDTLPRSNKPIPGGLILRLLDTDQFKALIHWRMERQDGDSQRFFLHAETGMDYARQILAEELSRDRKGKVYWRQVRRDNHLLDAEVLAAACADPEWLPSLKILAAHLRQQRELRPQTQFSKTEGIDSRRNVREFNRPGWLER
jgi:phage terminase large subunit GpA-like protein